MKISQTEAIDLGNVMIKYTSIASMFPSPRRAHQNGRHPPEQTPLHAPNLRSLVAGATGLKSNLNWRERDAYTMTAVGGGLGWQVDGARHGGRQLITFTEPSRRGGVEQSSSPHSSGESPPPKASMATSMAARPRSLSRPPGGATSSSGSILSNPCSSGGLAAPQGRGKTAGFSPARKGSSSSANAHAGAAGKPESPNRSTGAAR